jgi:AraC-like DNA-binding protein
MDFQVNVYAFVLLFAFLQGLSYVINTGFQKNFNDFVNAYRVADFQKKVNDPKLSHYTLLALAYECGFNSKSTFNRAVKKATGQLPSTFSTKTL